MAIFNVSLAMSIMNNMSKSQSRMTILGMQLSSGNRLVNAGVDPAGLAISTKMVAQIRGLEMAVRNTQDAISMFQTADGALSTINDMVQRIRELTVQASNSTNDPSDIRKIQDEIDQLLQEIDASAGRTEFNKKKLFDGSHDESNGGLWIQTGANAGQGARFYFNKIDLQALGLDGFNLFDNAGNVKTPDEISAMIGTVEKALGKVTDERSRIGAYENRLEFTINSLTNMIDNLSAANSRIADTDMAKTMMEYIKEQMRVQMSVMLLANLFLHEQKMMDILLSSLQPINSYRYKNRYRFF